VRPVAAIGSIIRPGDGQRGFRSVRPGVISPVQRALGILVPPSIVMVLFAGLDQHVGGQACSGRVLPGLVLAATGVHDLGIARGAPLPRLPRASWLERWRASRASWVWL